MNTKSILPFLLLNVLALSLLDSGRSLAEQSEAVLSLDPNMDYQAVKENPVTYDVDFSIVVTAPYKTKRLQVWLPIPQSDFAQEITDRKLTTFPMSVTPTIGAEKVYGNQFAYFEFQSPQGAQVIRRQFRVRAWELHWNLDPKRLVAVNEWPSSFAPYRSSDSMAVVVDQRFRDILGEIVPQRSNPFQDFSRVMSWVQQNVEYDHQVASLKASSEHILAHRRGHCSDYHSFCASLGREIGVPTRVVYGINPFPKNSPSHCKLEAYLAPYGWVSFDVSETQKLIAGIDAADGLSSAMKKSLVDRATQRLSSGFRDNTWFMQTKGTGYELEPKASQKVNVVRTAYIEADGVPLADPDPAAKGETEFSWMTVHDYRPDCIVPYPFADWNSLGRSAD